MKGGLCTKRLTVCLAAMAMIGAALAAAAQPPGVKGRERFGDREHRRGPGGGHDLETRELLEQVMTARLSRELALDDEQTVQLVRRFAEHREQARDRMKRRYQLLRELREALKEESDEAGIASKMNALIALDKEIATAPHVAESLAGEELTARQRARLYLFMADFETEMRGILERVRQGYGGGREGGPGPPMMPRPYPPENEGPGRPGGPRGPRGGRPDAMRNEGPPPFGARGGSRGAPWTPAGEIPEGSEGEKPTGY